MIGNLSRVTIAVPDLDAAIHQYKNVFGAFVSLPQDFPNHGIRVAMVKLPNTIIELITPMGESSPLENFLEKNPQGGLHHLCYEVLDIVKAHKSLIAAGFHVLGDGVPTIGYHGNPTLFFSPKDDLETLIEFEEIGSSKVHEPSSTYPIKPVRTSSQNDSTSFRGTEGVGIKFEVDFKRKTPEDNGEGE